jgi:hypothetical protein
MALTLPEEDAMRSNLTRASGSREASMKLRVVVLFLAIWAIPQSGMQAQDAPVPDRLGQLQSNGPCQPLDFDKIEIRKGDGKDTWMLVVTGTTGGSPKGVQLIPAVYVRQPDYWRIELVQCGKDAEGPETAHFTARLPLLGLLGTSGIEIVGAPRIERIDMPPK